MTPAVGHVYSSQSRVLPSVRLAIVAACGESRADAYNAGTCRRTRREPFFYHL
jgi:hypothetical protein